MTRSICDDNEHAKAAQASLRAMTEAMDQPMRRMEVHKASATVSASLAVAQEIRDLRIEMAKKRRTHG